MNFINSIKSESITHWVVVPCVFVDYLNFVVLAQLTINWLVVQVQKTAR